MNNPVSFRDWDGRELQITGTAEEVTALFNGLCLAAGVTLNYEKTDLGNKQFSIKITGINSIADKRFDEEQRNLSDIINSMSLFTLAFDESGIAMANGGGCFDQKTNTAFISKSTLGIDGPYYWNSRKTSIPFESNNSYVHYDVYDLIAHELLGHAHDFSIGIFQDRQWKARKIENDVQRKRGKKIRTNSDNSGPRLFIAPWESDETGW